MHLCGGPAVRFTMAFLNLFFQVRCFVETHLSRLNMSQVEWNQCGLGNGGRSTPGFIAVASWKFLHATIFMLEFWICFFHVQDSWLLHRLVVNNYQEGYRKFHVLSTVILIVSGKGIEGEAASWIALYRRGDPTIIDQ